MMDRPSVKRYRHVALHHHLLRRDDVGMGEDSWIAGRLQRNDGGMSVTERFGGFLEGRWAKAGEMNGIRDRHSNYPAFCGGTVSKPSEKYLMIGILL